jgi:hypothetical protein
MGKVRGIRFSDKEESMIEEFLEKNPLLDFSTLARVAILEFVKNPQINLIPIEKSLERENKHVRPVS